MNTYALLSTASTATLTTVLREHGLSNTFMSGVKPLNPNSTIVGPAFTLRYIPAREDLDDGPVDNLRDIQRLAIERVKSGDVFVIDARADTRAGTLGSILATRLQKRGAEGIITDGAFRDSPVIRDMGLGCYASAMNAHTNKTIHHPSEFQVPVACGGVSVFPGDIIVGDGEGIVVIPVHLAESVAIAANEREKLEGFLLDRVRAGESIIGTYPPDEKTLQAYQKSK